METDHPDHAEDAAFGEYYPVKILEAGETMKLEDDTAEFTAYAVDDSDKNDHTCILSEEDGADGVELIESCDDPSMKKSRVSMSQLPSNDLKSPSLGVPCDRDRCAKKCTFNICHERRRAVFEAYWSMHRHEQKSWVSNSISRETKRRDTTGKGYPSRRSMTYSYHLKDEGGISHEVCKTFFIATLGYHPKNDRFITTAVRSGSLESGVPSMDRRGRHVPSNKLDINPIKAHIESFGPSISRDRCEHAPKHRNLPSDVTIRFMHQDFQDKNLASKCSYETYRKVVRQLNITFTKPREEECEKCVRIEIHAKAFCHEGIFRSHRGRAEQSTDESAGDTAQNTDCPECLAWIQHKEAADSARRRYEVDSGEDWPDDWSVRSAVLQREVMIPRMPGNKTAAFTQRLLAFHETFATVGMQSSRRSQKTKKKKTLSVVWHEGIAGCAVEEMTSAFTTALTHHTERDVKHAVIWADGCTGQNKNWTLLISLISTVNSQRTAVEDITLRFFEPGHSLTSADFIHRGVELEMKRRRGGTLYDFDDFVDVISDSSPNTEVIRLKSEDVLAWKDDQSQAKLKKVVELSRMAELQVRRGSANIFYKTSHDQEEHCELDFTLDMRKQPRLPPRLRQEDRGVPPRMKNDLIDKLVPLMPETRRRFWQDLKVSQADVENGLDE